VVKHWNKLPRKV